MKLVFPGSAPAASVRRSTVHLSSRGGAATFEDALAVEHVLEIYINEVLSYELVCSPTQLADLVLGRLLSENIISGAQDVDTLYLCRDGLRARVYLKDRAIRPSAEPMPERVASCCTGNRTLAAFPPGREPQRLTPIPYQRRWIYALAEALKEDMPIYRATHGTHSCLLLHHGQILTRSEDLGRHNALDKVLGWALRHEISLRECIVYTSGRVPVDMVTKVICAGVPVFVSKAMPTDRAVRLARAYNLTLIGAARADSMVLLTETEGDNVSE